MSNGLLLTFGLLGGLVAVGSTRHGSRAVESVKSGDTVHFLLGWDRKKHPMVTGVVLRPYPMGERGEWIVGYEKDGKPNEVAVHTRSMQAGPAPSGVVPFRPRGSLDVERMTLDQIKAILRAAQLKVSGNRPQLQQSLDRLMEARKTDPALLPTMTLVQLRVLAKSLGILSGYAWTKAGIIMAITRALTRDLSPKERPRKLVRTLFPVVWTNPFTERVEELGFESTRMGAERLASTLDVRYGRIVDAARKHLPGLVYPEVRLGPSGFPEASESDRERLMAIDALERRAMGPALSGDAAGLRRIRAQMDVLLRETT